MSKNRSLRLACLLLVLAWAGAAQAANYTVTGGGAQGQIGDGLMIPIQDPTTMSPPTGAGLQRGTGTMFPPLLMPAKAGAAVQQTLTSPAKPMQIKAKPGTIRRIPAGKKAQPVALNNPNVFQVTTKLSFSGPAPAFGTATFMATGRTGAPTSTWVGQSVASTVRYKKTAGKFQFGGPSRTKVVVLSPIRVWAHKTMAPCKHTSLAGPDAACVSAVLGAYPGTLAVAGGTVTPNPVTGGMGRLDMTPGGPPGMSPAIAGVNAGPAGTIISFFSIAMSGGTATNMATSEGFPWTTGQVSLMAPLAKGGAENFVITGNDGRTAMGAGTISLVAGSLSARAASGDNSNKNWLRLPEPGAVLGAAAALAMLGICHGLVRRRSR